MEIKDTARTIEQVIPGKTAEYTKQDILKLIADDLEKQGYKIDNSFFKLDHKYVTDEWGMNPLMRVEFVGVKLELKEV